MKHREVLVSLSFAGILLSLTTEREFFILISGILLFVYLAFPSWAEFIGEKLLYFFKLVGRIASVIFLSIVFYLILYPVAIFYRLMNSNPLLLKNENINSTFIEREKEYTKKDLEDMW